jgi:hypothetical protein
MQPIVLMVILVFAAGGTGGVINAVMTENGFPMPKKETVDGATTIIRPGVLGNVLVGGAAALISWGLYGPLSAFVIVSTDKAGAGASIEQGAQSGLTLAALVGAMLIGISGAKWLTNEVDKNLLKAAVTRAAGSAPSVAAAQEMAIATPARTLEIARTMVRPNP